MNPWSLASGRWSLIYDRRSLIVLAAAFAALVPTPTSWVESVYSLGFYSFLQRSLTPLTSRVPFALFDLLAVLVVGGLGDLVGGAVEHRVAGHTPARGALDGGEHGGADRRRVPRVPRDMGPELPPRAAEREARFRTGQGYPRGPAGSRAAVGGRAQPVARAEPWGQLAKLGRAAGCSYARVRARAAPASRTANRGDRQAQALSAQLLLSQGCYRWDD